MMTASSTKPRKKKKSSKRRMPAKIDSHVKLRAIDAALKAIILAAEPPIDHNQAHVDPTFHVKLDAALAQLSAQETPFRFVEGFRTTDRQKWLYGSGRSGVPYGRPGPILTHADGVQNLSKHQGDGTIGSGKAADCYPLRAGSVYIPPNDDPVWSKYADAVIAQGLVAGHKFPTLKDSPHCELE
jgi:hypothetical protein